MADLKEIYKLGDTGIDGRTLLGRILRKYEGRAWTGFIWLRICTTV
jgi:hypothetical protein